MALVALLLAACDEVSLEDRLVYVEPPKATRAVLIEDYTGQYCVNCPNASKEIENLVEEFGDTTVIAVAFHAGPFGKNKQGVPSPLYTEVGNEYFNYWGLSYQPIGVIDRLGGVDYPDWTYGVNYEIQQEPGVYIMASPNVDYITHDAQVVVDIIGLEDAPINGKLQVWLVEDSIDSFQYMPDGSINEHYNHMHVFRASISDKWGDSLPVTHGDLIQKTYDFHFDDAWVLNHCSVVVFYYDDEGIKQVTKQKFDTVLL